ncbi:arginine--tRNA ligase [Candidatus Thorarchaeota archaeon]|nr:MAG: arginine--tRNA ligase [Candidatus Thorarchaeota archaeon]
MTKAIDDNPWDSGKQAVVKMLAEAADTTVETVYDSIEVPPDSVMGDLASTLAFTLAKELKKNPAAIASEVLAKLQKLIEKESLVSKVETKGPYINIFFDRAAFAKTTITSVSKSGSSYGTSSQFKGKRVLIEFPAVNPSKPWHIGHARNAILGDTLSNILENVGYEVVRLEYINDLGLQIAQLVWKLKQVSDDAGDQKYDHFLGHLYVEVQETFDNSEEVQKEVREVSRHLEDLQSEDAKISGEMVRKCVLAQCQTGYRLGIFHNYQVWESAIAHSGILSLARDMMIKCDNIFIPEEGDKAGCIVADLSVIDEFKDLKDPYKILFRSDGTRTYTGADVALQLWKFGLIKDPFKYAVFDSQPNGEDVKRTTLQGGRGDLGKFDIVLNVIGTRQAHPQKMVYTVLDLMGFTKESENSHHIAYEFVGLEGQDFSGRQGTWVGYSTDDVLNKSTEMALTEVNQRNPDESDEFKAMVANQVAVGAIRYFMLNASPDRKITFRWEQALDFNGDAAPYLQYSLARAKRILEKTERDNEVEVDLYQLTSDPEFELVKAISKYPEEVLDVARAMKKEVWGTSFFSNRITAYGYGLATLFSKFYDSCPVLKAEPRVKKARLALVESFMITMTNCLQILGIPIVDRM